MRGKRTVFLVDDDVTNLTIGYNILSEVYNAVTINSGPGLFRMLGRLSPDLILLDVDMPAMSGFEVIEALKRNEAQRDIPVIFLTARNDPDSELAGLSCGAGDYIVKPFSPQVLLKRVEIQLEGRRELLRAQALLDRRKYQGLGAPAERPDASGRGRQKTKPGGKGKAVCEVKT